MVYKRQLTDAITVRNDVRQDCLLSPFLFLFVIDWIMKQSTSQKNGIRWTSKSQLDDLELADDLAPLSHTQQLYSRSSTEDYLAIQSPSLKKKIRIFNINIKTVLLCGAERHGGPQ